QGVPGITHLGDMLWGDVEVRPSDQIAVVRGQVTWRSLRRKLAEHDLCIPHGIESVDAGSTHSYTCGITLMHMMANNFPHALEAQCGSWRDWILGMRIVLADGSVVHTGSHVVKSVAGYDLHKLMIGARST